MLFGHVAADGERFVTRGNQLLGCALHQVLMIVFVFELAINRRPEITLDFSQGHRVSPSPACLISTANVRGCPAYSILLRIRKVPMMPVMSEDLPRKINDYYARVTLQRHQFGNPPESDERIEVVVRITEEVAKTSAGGRKPSLVIFEERIWPAIDRTGHPDGLETGHYVKPTVFANVTNDMSHEFAIACPVDTALQCLQ
jgi:hypothetical protein